MKKIIPIILVIIMSSCSYNSKKYKLSETGYEVTLRDKYIQVEDMGKEAAAVKSKKGTIITLNIISFKQANVPENGTIEDLRKTFEYNKDMYKESEGSIEINDIEILGNDALNLDIVRNVAKVRKKSENIITILEDDKILNISIEGTDREEIDRAYEDFLKTLKK